jgi:BASS family bile acid:Na+ symporter
MNATTLIVVGLQAGIVLLVFGLGLNARFKDAAYLFLRPGQFIRSLLSMYVVLPVFAVTVVVIFDGLPPPVKIALVALAVSPVPPALPRKVLKAGGESPYIIGLLAAMALVSIVFVPLAMAVLGMIFDRELYVAPSAVVRLVLITVLIPLAAGMLVRRLAPAFAARSVRPATLLATVLLVVAALPILLVVGPGSLSLIGNGTLASFVAFIAVGLASGHLLGGARSKERTVLALSSACRHPGIALTIAFINYPDEKLVLGAVFLYLLLTVIVTIPYVVWSRRHQVWDEGEVKA